MPDAHADARHALDQFRADPSRPGTWRGVKGQDATLLQDALDHQRFNPTSIFTWVACGCLPPGVKDLDPAHPDYGYVSGYFKRIDLVANVADRWYVIEIKPSASYMALGQILTYTNAARARYPILRAALPGILTDCPDPDIAELIDRYSIRVWRDPDCPFIPLGHPT